MGENKENRKDKYDYFIRLIMLYAILAATVILTKVTAQDIWYDEVFSIKFAELRFTNMLEMASRDVHPPLYYIYLKGCMSIFGLFGMTHIQACKLASCIPLMAILIFAFTWVRKRLGSTAMVVYSLLMVMMPQLATYYVEIRMYSFALMLVTFAFAAMSDILQSEEVIKKQFVTFFIMSMAAAYTQYFACIGIMAVYIMLIIGILLMKKDRKYLFGVLGMIIASVLLYIPWLPAFIKQITQVSSTFWIQPMTLRSLPGCLKFIFLPDMSSKTAAYVFACIMIFICVTSYIYTIKSKPQKEVLIRILTAPAALMLIVIVGYIFSIMGSPIFTYRYMIPMFGILYINIAEIISKYKSKSIVCTVMFFLIIMCYFSFDGFCAEENKKANAWTEAEQKLAELEPQSSIITNFDHVTTISAYYLEGDDIYLYEGETDGIIKDMFGGCEYIDDLGINELVEKEENVYFLGSFNVRDEIVEHWDTLGIEAEYLGECLLERYWFNIYKLSIK